VNNARITPINLEGKALEKLESFIYDNLGSIVDKKGGTVAEVKIRTGKAKVAFQQLKADIQILYTNSYSRARKFREVHVHLSILRIFLITNQMYYVVPIE
jgi:hypothetical protein